MKRKPAAGSYAGVLGLSAAIIGLWLLFRWYQQREASAPAALSAPVHPSGGPGGIQSLNPFASTAQTAIIGGQVVSFP